jgi:demethylmenaquinone methyltransferase/2-methoxy-6-polyprenyl-1,4-benzoquinol methylase
VHERDLADVLDEQKRYYDLRAPDYGDSSISDRAVPGAFPSALMRETLDALAPTGDVLELACGPGLFTEQLVARARSLTAVDASPAMLARNRENVGDDRVTYVEADLFTWMPNRAYDTVFFGFWLSHVPPAAFDPFFAMLRRALVPGGRVLFVDEDDRCPERVDGHGTNALPTATRRLRDGREFDIVKVFWTPADLTKRLTALGWDFEIHRVGPTFLRGAGEPRAVSSRGVARPPDPDR